MVSRVLTSVCAGLALGFCASPAAAVAEPTGRLVVLGASGSASAGEARTAVAAAGMRDGGSDVPQIGLVTARPRPGESLARAASRLAAQPGVVRVEREQRMRLREVPDDPAFATVEPTAGTPTSQLPAGTVLAWPLLRQGFPAAWDLTHGASALVGVIDTGVDATHPEFAGKLAALVDQQSPRGARGPAGVDEEGHGTHVASLACAATGNGMGSAGAGHDCRLVIEKTDLSDASIAASIVDATDRGVRVINMSFGADGSRPVSVAIRRAVRYAVRHDVVLVAAAADQPVREQGDPSNLLQPTGSGRHLDAGRGLSVTAAAFNDERAAFAGFGSQISIAAYGTAGIPGSTPPGILGAFPDRLTRFEQGTRPCGCRTSVAGDTRYGYLAGTSMAAPQVAGAAALVRSMNPDLSAREVVRLLKRTARRDAGRGGWSAQLGWGILDAGRAVEAARTVDRGVPVSRLSATAGARPGRVVLSWTASDPTPAGVVSSGVTTVEVVAVRLSDRHVERLASSAGAHQLTFDGEPGASYGFFSRARDRAGNEEARPARADAVVRAPE